MSTTRVFGSLQGILEHVGDSKLVIGVLFHTHLIAIAKELIFVGENGITYTPLDGTKGKHFHPMFKLYRNLHCWV